MVSIIYFPYKVKYNSRMEKVFFYLSIIQGLIGQGIGIYSIFKGVYKPQRMTRFLYFLMSIIFIGTLIAQKSWDALGFALAQNLGGFFIFLLSFKYGMGGFNKSDIIVLVGTFISGTIWLVTKNPTYALLFGIITDLIAFIPTFLKTWVLPYTEDWKFYASDVLASSFSGLSLTRFTIGDLAYPVYIFILNLSVTLLIVIRRKVVGKPKLK